MVLLLYAVIPIIIKELRISKYGSNHFTFYVCVYMSWLKQDKSKQPASNFTTFIISWSSIANGFLSHNMETWCDHFYNNQIWNKDRPTTRLKRHWYQVWYRAQNPGRLSQVCRSLFGLKDQRSTWKQIGLTRIKRRVNYEFKNLTGPSFVMINDRMKVATVARSRVTGKLPR